MWICCGMSLTPSTYTTKLICGFKGTNSHFNYPSVLWFFQNLKQTKTQILLIQRKINNTYPAWERKNWSNPSVIESYQIPTNAHQDICRSSCVLCTWFYPHLRHECDASVDATFQTFKITLDIAKLNSSKSTAISLSHKNSNV